MGASVITTMKNLTPTVGINWNEHGNDMENDMECWFLDGTSLIRFTRVFGVYFAYALEWVPEYGDHMNS